MVKEFDHDAISTKLGYFYDIHFKKITSMTDTGNINNRAYQEFHTNFGITMLTAFIHIL